MACSSAKLHGRRRWCIRCIHSTPLFAIVCSRLLIVEVEPPGSISWVDPFILHEMQGNWCSSWSSYAVNSPTQIHARCAALRCLSPCPAGSGCTRWSLPTTMAPLCCPTGSSTTRGWASTAATSCCWSTTIQKSESWGVCVCMRARAWVGWVWCLRVWVRGWVGCGPVSSSTGRDE